MNLGPYIIQSKIGQGGNGTVYKAKHGQTERVVALKILNKDLDVNRTRNEVRLHAGLSHSGIAKLYDLIEEQGQTIIVMEYVDGVTLKEYIKFKGTGISSSVKHKLFNKILEPVKYLHQKKIIHRDLKPSNIKIQSDGELKLLDFGISVGISTPKMTRQGHVVGSLKYAAPERLSGLQTTQSDIWSLGAIYFEIMTGSSLIHAENTEEGFRQIKDEKFINSRLSNIDDSAKYILKKCLRQDPNKRYGSIEEIQRNAKPSKGNSMFSFLQKFKP